MNSDLLATKLRIPPEPRQVVRRARLVDALERGIPDHRLVLVSAPAGFGKTTLLSQWARASRFSVAWLSLGKEDNDLGRFFRYLVTGWEGVQPGVAATPLGVVLDGTMPDTQAVLAAFINVAGEAADHIAFVLDDYHLVEDPAIHEALTFLLDHLPPNVHFVLSERAEPPLPLARYRARRQLLEVRAEDLQFRQNEAESFLNDKMELALPGEEIVRLQERLEGWVAGLQLAALSLQRRPEGAGLGALPLGGRHRFIADYLSQDVLAHLPDGVRLFLLQTSIGERLCGPLCDAITGGTESQAMLELLERENLFVVPLDESREWFRYHHLFADFLRGELERRYPGEVAALHARAARWYVEHDLPDEAFFHAIAGRDAEVALEITRRHAFNKLLGGEIALVIRWMESIPEEWLHLYPDLLLTKSASYYFSGQVEACVRAVEAMERQALERGDDARHPLARGTAVRCFIACMQNDLARAEALAQQALPNLPDEFDIDLQLRRGIYGSLGDTYRANGRWEQAKECYLKVLDLAGDSTFRVGVVHCYGALADLELRQGRLRAATAYWQRALAATQEREAWGTFPLPLIGWVNIRTGEILYEWDRLAEAADYLEQGLERARLGGDAQAMLAGYLIEGRMKLGAGDVAGAGEDLERARPLVESAPFPDWIGRFGRFEVELRLAQDRPRAAVERAEEMLRADTLEGRQESEESRLAMARALVARGDAAALGRAQSLLARLLSAAEAEGRAGVAIEALALQALAQWKRGEKAEAMTSLERALRAAEPEGYVRLFADMGLPMARLLQEARARGVMPGYVGRLLEAFGSGLPGAASTEGGLPEPLSAREQEVLELLAAGLTNREIAAKLVVSPETVKKHTGSIYGKLNAGNRTEAVARARELELLG